MPRKSRPLPSMSKRELAARIRRHHVLLHTEWATRLTIDPIDWRYLEHLHVRITWLERELPWLKKSRRR